MGKVLLGFHAWEIPLSRGDVAVLPALTEFRLHPFDTAVLTSVSIDPEYAVDLVYWRFRRFIADRAEASVLANRLYLSTHPVVSLGEHLCRLESILDQMTVVPRKVV
ncbi:MAG: hypothetical protein ACK5LO_12435 [Leucobacter sp.]